MRILKLITLTTFLSIPVLAVAQPPDQGQGQQARTPQGAMIGSERRGQMREHMQDMTPRRQTSTGKKSSSNE